jgi:hypothetical protein
MSGAPEGLDREVGSSVFEGLRCATHPRYTTPQSHFVPLRGPGLRICDACMVSAAPIVWRARHVLFTPGLHKFSPGDPVAPTKHIDRFGITNVAEHS